MTTKFSTRQSIQKTPWVCKRSPPCLPPPDPTDEQLLLTVTIIWKQPPFGFWPHPGWYYIDKFNIPLVRPVPPWWSGESKPTDDGHVRAELSWNVFFEQYTLGFNFHPARLLPLKRGTSIRIDLPETPFIAGPFETTDDEGIATITSSLMAPP